MNKRNLYHPFSLASHDGTHSLLLTDLKWESFEKCGFLGSGHDWTRLIENYISKNFPSMIGSISFDSEADMFCLIRKDKELLKNISDEVSTFYREEKELEKNIIEYAQYA